MIKVLYIGSDSPGTTSLYRARAIQRRGYDVSILNLAKEFRGMLNRKIPGAIHYRTGYRFLQGSVMKWLKVYITANERPDVIWVDSGELLGPACIKLMKNWCNKIILYNHDDPTGPRDGRRFDSLKKAIPFYSLCVVVREESYQEFRLAGSNNVMKVYRSYDEVEHHALVGAIPEKFQSQVSFIGTWMKGEGRDTFLLDLVKNGLNISIWGDHWQKSPVWEQLKAFYRGKALSGRDYVAAIQGAKISIGMLSKGNRDLHTTRSAEIPYIGGLFCAERTTEHQEMYKEGTQAIFWNNSKECAEVCKQILDDDDRRARIADAGRRRVLELKIGNEDICEKALAFVMERPV